MKIYFLWSGEISKRIAEKFKAIFHAFFNEKIEAYFSERDIKPTENWRNNMMENLKKCDGGLVFLTKKGSDSPWLMFELGGLGVLDKKIYLLKINTNEVPEQIKNGQAKDLDRKGLIETIKQIGDDFNLTIKNNVADIIDLIWQGINDEIRKLPLDDNIRVPETEVIDRLKIIESRLIALTKQEIDEKHTREAREQSQSTDNKKQQDIKALLATFEEEVIIALKNLFGEQNVKPNVTIKGTDIPIDVLLELPDKLFVIEIRYAKSHGALQRAVERLNKSIESLKGGSIETKGNIFPIIIAPPSIADKKWKRDSVNGVPVLKFDQKEKKFIKSPYIYNKFLGTDYGKNK